MPYLTSIDPINELKFSKDLSFAAVSHGNGCRIPTVTGFDSRSGNVRLTVDKVALGQVSSVSHTDFNPATAPHLLATSSDAIPDTGSVVK
jgi:hypothetical protein